MTFQIDVPVEETLEALDHGANWIQGDWTDDTGMCLHQGIRVCQYVKGDAFIIEQVADAQGWGTSFNDESGTTFDVVKQRLVEHREVLPDELEAVFGPQWLAVVGVVRTGASATPEQLQTLATARAAAEDAAWAAAWAAAWDAARAAAGDAARDAAGDAAGEAARAVVCHDLIGDTFTQTDYDTLTAPWKAVFGDPMAYTGEPAS